MNATTPQPMHGITIMNYTSVADKWEQKRLRLSHQHPLLINVNRVLVETLGQRVADQLAILMGSWTFMIVQSIILAFWIALNVAAWMRHWDRYPFILLNLALSFQAAYAAPIIMMSQNRPAAKDRLMAEQELHG